MMSTETNPVCGVKGLFHDPNHYMKAFGVFSQDSAKFQVLADWSENVFVNAVVDKLQVKIPNGEMFRALGVGSGAGEMDSKMMCKLLKRFPRINNCLVEPMDSQIKLHKDLVKKMEFELVGVTHDWHKQGLNQFRKTRSESKQTSKFHFISAIHSVYHIDDLQDSLRWLYDQLEDGGTLLVIMVSDDSGTGRLWNRFNHFEGTFTHYITSGHVRDMFTKEKISFTNCKQASFVNITNCFEEGNKDGRLKVDFLTQVLNFEKTASLEIRKEVMDYLGGPECSERKNGDVLFDNTWEAIIATKN